jgi:HlyD family type I secretion membrane fusion protein
MSPRPDIRFPVRLGNAVFLAFFGIFGGWAVAAPLATAALALGEVVVESHRKTIQHLEGGIVETILVTEGAWVEAGQILIRLETTQAEAALRQFAGELDAQRALATRLAAERDGVSAVAFPADLRVRAKADPQVATILAGQARIFATRRAMLENQRDVLRQRIGQLRAQIDGNRLQLAALGRQRALIQTETEGAELLMRQGLMPHTRVLALRREAASLDGRSGELTSAVAAKEQAIGETDLSILSLDSARADEVARELREVESRVAELEQKVRANRDILARQDIVAPVAGRVVDLKVFTAGGIIAPAQNLMDIVPARDALWVTARVSPGDIDMVRPGQAAQVMLTAFNQRLLPPLPGRLVTISADRLVDETTGQAYFTARIDLDAEAIAHLDGIELVPGMPVQAQIVTGRQTLFAYLLAPLRASLSRAMKEG